MTLTQFKNGDDANALMAKLQGRWNRITLQFADLMDSWSGLASKYLSMIVTINSIEEGSFQFTGIAFGKSFTVKLTSHIVSDDLYGRVIVHIPNELESNRTLAAEFWLSPEGQISSLDGAEIIHRADDNAPDYRLLCAIIQAVAAA